jgi:hypothetical protein
LKDQLKQALKMIMEFWFLLDPANYAEGEKLRQELIANNIKATLAFTLEGPQLMVWPNDEAKARNLIRGRV